MKKLKILSRCAQCNSPFPMRVEKHGQFRPTICSRTCLQKYIRYYQEQSPSKMTLSDFLGDDLKIAKPTAHRRSDYEREFEQFLIDSHLTYIYEGIYFRDKYLIDYVVLGKRPVFFEVKGIWEPGAYPKVKEFSEFLAGRSHIFTITEDVLRLIKWKKEEK